MKNKIGILLTVAMLAVLVIPVSASQFNLVPITSIISVVQDQSVTIRTDYFPANDTFNVLMGLSGTQGIGGILVSRLTTGAGGSILAKFHIPPELQGQQIISIRLESPYSGYYSYNWFYNSTAAVGPDYYPTQYYYGTPYYYSATPTWRPIEEGMPRFDIIAVQKGGSVSVRLINYPANRNYGVYMKDGRSAYTTWYSVTAFNSASGGIFNAGPWIIPAILRYSPQISMKIYDTSRKIFTVNRFDNENYP
jgi:hypothetical protein